MRIKNLFWEGGVWKGIRWKEAVTCKLSISQSFPMFLLVHSLLWLLGAEYCTHHKLPFRLVLQFLILASLRKGRRYQLQDLNCDSDRGRKALYIYVWERGEAIRRPRPRSVCSEIWSKPRFRGREKGKCSDSTILIYWFRRSWLIGVRIWKLRRLK